MSGNREPVNKTPSAIENGDGRLMEKGIDPVIAGETIIDDCHESWATHMGVNVESFKKAHSGPGIIEFKRPIKTRHLHMIAIGGAIGAGFFVGSGSALHNGGPGSLFIDFLIIGIMMFNVVYALGELGVMYPVSGGFYTYSSRFIDPSWGFSMGWVYLLQWASVLPLELTVCGITIQYWNDSISNAAWISIFFVIIIIINLFGAIGYAEEEFWSAIFKIGATVIFMIIAIVLVCGGGPTGGIYDHYWGAKLWYNPGAFQNGFKGFCSVFVTAAFSFAGSELVSLAAAESSNPAKSLPGAVKQIFWRITIFYIFGLFFIGLLIDPNDPALLTAGVYNDPKASPFVLIGEYAGLKGLDSFMNLVILVSVLSISTSAVYGGSRTLTALAQQGSAPELFTYIDKSGRPLFSVIAVLLFGPIGYVSLSVSGPVVFTWLLSLGGLAALFSWGSICVAHIRFRHAWKYHGHSLEEIPFRAPLGIWGSYLGLFLNIICLIAQFYTAIAAPIGESGLSDATSFFEAALAAPLVLVLWVVGYVVTRKGFISIKNIDVDTGRRELDWVEINAHRLKVASWPRWRRVLGIFV